MKRQKERKYRNERQQDNWRMEGKAGGECTELIFRDDGSKFYEQEASNNIIKKHYKQKLLNYEEKIPKPPEKHALFTRATKRPPAKFIQPRDGWASPSSHAATLSPMSPPAMSSCGTGQEQDVAAFRCWTAGRAALNRKQVTAGGVATVWRSRARGWLSWTEAEMGSLPCCAWVTEWHVPEEGRAREGLLESLTKLNCHMAGKMSQV